jgi:hypothetical protein
LIGGKRHGSHLPRAMALLAAVLQNWQDVAIKGDLLRHDRPSDENGGNQQGDHCLYYIRSTELPAILWRRFAD